MNFLYTFCAKNAVLRTFRYFLALFLESAETPLFVQINVFGRLASEARRKYTSLIGSLVGACLVTGMV